MGLKRIILHWSAGEDSNQIDDVEHYHFIVDRWGKVVKGNYKPEDNISAADGKYAKHTRNCNTGSIGVSMDAMKGAIEKPFYPGTEPITEIQLEVFVQLVAKLLKQYSIPLTPTTCLTHAEVQTTLKIPQRGKWDITWLPGMSKPGDPVSVGNILRHKISVEMNAK